MRIASIALVALVAVSLAPSLIASEPAGCTVYTYSAVSVGSFHVWGNYAEVWEETNGLAGLQRSYSYCAGGLDIPPDTCVRHQENAANVACMIMYPSNFLGRI